MVPFSDGVYILFYSNIKLNLNNENICRGELPLFGDYIGLKTLNGTLGRYKFLLPYINLFLMRLYFAIGVRNILLLFSNISIYPIILL